MNRYNDYTRLTRHWLRRYNDFRVAVADMKKEVNEREKRLNQEEQLERLKADINKIELVLDRIDRALDALDDETAALLKERFIKKESCVKIAFKFNFSESCIRQKSAKAVERMALIMFGMKAMPKHTSFVFAI